MEDGSKDEPHIQFERVQHEVVDELACRAILFPVSYRGGAHFQEAGMDVTNLQSVGLEGRSSKGHYSFFFLGAGNCGLLLLL